MTRFWAIWSAIVAAVSAFFGAKKAADAAAAAATSAEQAKVTASETKADAAIKVILDEKVTTPEVVDAARKGEF